MVMSEDEQGYAPAAFLEPLEEGNREDVHPEGETSEGRVWCGVYVRGCGVRGGGRVWI